MSELESGASLAQETPPRPLWPALDIGGTTLRLLLVDDAGPGATAVVLRLDRGTPRGLTALLGAVDTLYRQAKDWAHEHQRSLVEALAVGAPGRHVRGSDEHRHIAPGSAGNLEAWPGEFDELDLQGELARALRLPRDRVELENDAICQGCFHLAHLLAGPQRAQLLGERVVCIQPGTGLGGCVAEVDADGEVAVFTDGHLSELALHPVTHRGQVDGVDVVIETLERGRGLQLSLSEGDRHHDSQLDSPDRKQAEDLLSGAGLARLSRALDRELSRVIGSSPLAAVDADAPIDSRLLSRCLLDDPPQPIDPMARQLAELVAELAGLALQRLTWLLQQGQAHKVERFPQWREADRQRLAGVRRFVLGGGLVDTPLGIRLRRTAEQAWQQAGGEMSFLLGAQSDDAGGLGALLRVPAERRLELLTSGSSGS